MLIMEENMKYELRLGDRVLWKGEVAKVDALTQTMAALVVERNNDYVFAKYEDIQRA